MWHTEDGTGAASARGAHQVLRVREGGALPRREVAFGVAEERVTSQIVEYAVAFLFASMGVVTLAIAVRIIAGIWTGK